MTFAEAGKQVSTRRSQWRRDARWAPRGTGTGYRNGHREQLVCFVCFMRTWGWVKTNSTPVVHIKIAGIYGCSSH
jgi:hypothetical protein